MNEKRNGKKEFGTILLGAVVAITSCAFLFNLATESVVAAELGKLEQVPTSYNAGAVPATKETLPKGYQKADYQVVQDPLEYYKDKKPTSKDLTMEAAAELGAQAIWEIWGVDLKGATIYMGYDPASKSFPRACWTGDVRFGERKKPDGTPGINGYWFMIDAVTGNRFSVSMGRTLGGKVSLEFDGALAKNPKAYEDLAKAAAEKYGFVQGPVQSATYNGQGYQGNDPSISVDVTGSAGDTALLSFSRYDKKLTGVSYPESVRISEALMEELLAETETQTAELQEKGGTTVPTLIALP